MAERNDYWVLTLDDGSEVVGPRPNAFKDIDHARMRMLTVHDEGRVIRVDLGPPKRPIIVRRVRRRMNLVAGGEDPPEVVLGVGWWIEGPGGEKLKTIAWIEPDGTITLTPRHIKEIE